jgi:transketolase
MDLRKQFFDTMGELAKRDESIFLMVGDLGFSFMEEYARTYPKQYLNCGCIEQSMIGISAGMALSGKKPYVYSGAIFALMRPYEQVRDDIAFNNLNVKIVGTGASGFLGFTHNLVGDENEKDLLKNLPISQFYPTNKLELREALLNNGPTYIRI